MESQLISKQILISIRQCLLELFWHKNDLFLFLTSIGCPNSCISYASTNRHELTKRHIIDDIFLRLQKRSDRGIQQFNSMAKELKGWSTFTDPQFSIGGNLDRNRAQTAIQQLNKLLDLQEKEIKLDRVKKEEREEELKRNIQLSDLNKKFQLLCKGLDENGKEINSQRRGYLLEDLLKNLFTREGLASIDCFSFNIKGEQIDGSIKYDGEHYILEAKWQEQVVATNALYQFSYKVEGKMYGRGIFISINGFSPESVVALTSGKALKVILVDGADLVPILDGLQTTAEMLDRKIKAAQTMGHIYVDTYDLKSKIAA